MAAASSLAERVRYSPKSGSGIDRLPRDSFGFGSIAGLAVVAGAAVRAEAIHRDFDERRTVAGSRARDGVANRFVHGEDVDAIDRHRRHSVCLGPGADVARGWRVASGDCTE